MKIPYLKKNGKYILKPFVNERHQNLIASLQPPYVFSEEEAAKKEYEWLTSHKPFYREYDQIGFFHDGLAKVTINNKVFFIDYTEQEIKDYTEQEYNLSKNYLQVGQFENGIAIAKIFGGGERLIYKNGTEVNKKDYENIQKNQYGLFEAMDYTGKTEVFDKYGRIINLRDPVKPSLKRDNTFYVCENLILISYSDHSYRAIDFSGMEIFKTKEFRFISRFYQNIAIAEKKDGKIFIVNKYLDLIKKIEIKGDEDIDINGFGDGYFRIKGDNTEKLISMQGEIVCEYAEINYMKEGFFRVAKLINGKKKFAFINSKFKELTSFKYDFLNDFSENTASFRIENNWGIMNLCGKDIIKPSYSYIGKCKNGFIPVSLGDYRVVDIGNFKRKFYYGKFGFITKSGINVCPIIYDSVSDFDTNLIARVKLNGLFGLINEKGDEITKVQYDWIGENYDRFYYVVFENVGFVIDNTGYQFTEVEFTKDIEECGMYLDSDEENVYI